MAKAARPKATPVKASTKKPAALADLTTGSNAPQETERKLEKALGAHIRRLRQAKDLSIAGMAEAANISAGMLSKLETGQISPSLTTLQSIASALAIPMSSLFAEFESRRDCSYVKKGQGVVIERRGTKAGHVYRLLGHALRGEIGVEPYLIELRPGAAPYTEFRHAGIEFIYMISGHVTYRHDDQSYDLYPGDALMFDSGALHGPQSLEELPATYLSIIIYEQPVR